MENKRQYGECRCCLRKGNHRSISKKYYVDGSQVKYKNYFLECFNIFLSTNSKLSDLICSSCIKRLFEARRFRTQVLRNERRQLKACIHPVETVFVTAMVPPTTKTEDGEVIIKTEQETELSVSPTNLAMDPDSPGFKYEDKEIQYLSGEPTPRCDTEIVNHVDDLCVTAWRVAENIRELTSFPDSYSDMDSDSDLVPGERRLLARFSSPPPPLPTRDSLFSLYPVYYGRLEQLKDKIVTANSIDISTPPESQKVPFRLHNQKLAQVANASALLENSNATAFKTKMRSGFPCFYCRNIFSDPKVLREHQLKHPKSLLNKLLSKYTADALVIYADITNLKCTLCNQCIGSLNELKTHLIDTHDKKIHTDVQERVIPFKLEDRESDYACQECGKRFETFGATERHMNAHYSHYVCEECGAGFVTKRRLKVHAYLIHSKKTDLIYCEPCKKQFESKTKYKIHLDYVHKKLKKNKCNQCSETFIDYFTRQRHMEFKHGVKLLSYKCKSCEKSFNRKYSLKLHYNRIHIARKDVQCDSCPFMCFTKSELREHMYKHGDETFSCALCPKAFARKRSLNMHVKRIHS